MLTYLANQIAKLQTCYNFISTNKNKYTGRALIKSRGILTSIPSTSSKFISTLGPLGIYMNVDLQKATKLALKLLIWCQEYSQC